MTDLLPRTVRGRAERAADDHATPPVPGPVSWAGVGAALRAAGLGLLAVTVLVLVAWATAADSGASASEAVATAAQIWLVGHGAPLTVPGGTFGLAPLGLLLLPAGLVLATASRAAADASVRRLRGVAALVAALAGTYAALAGLVAVLARTDQVRPSPVGAFLAAGLLAAAAGSAGALRGAGRTRSAVRLVPRSVRRAGRAAAGAVLVLTAGGALLAGLSLAVHHGRTAALLEGLDVGLPGAFLVLLLCLAYLPTAALWGAAFLAGPGFAVGSGTSVALVGVELGPVPGLPLLAALPDSAAPGWAVPLAAAVPVAAGLVAAELLWRDDRRSALLVLTTWSAVLRAAGTTGALAGGAAGVLAWLASGPAGPGRLGEMGPAVPANASAVAVEVAAVVLAALAVRLWRGRTRGGESPGDRPAGAS